MNPQGQDYKQLLTAVIKKQIVILGPDITLSKARNVKGLTVAQDGTVTDVQGEPQAVTQALIDQFVQLSGLIVKKTMEPLLNMSQPAQPAPAQTPTQPAAATAPTQPAIPIPAATAQAAIDQAMQTPQNPIQPTSTTPNQTQPTNAQPAKNPLAA